MDDLKVRTWDELLKEWKLSQYIEKFEEQGYDLLEIWDDLDLNSLRQDIGLKLGHAKLFIKKRDQLLKKSQNNSV